MAYLVFQSLPMIGPHNCDTFFERKGGGCTVKWAAEISRFSLGRRLGPRDTLIFGPRFLIFFEIQKSLSHALEASADRPT